MSTSTNTAAELQPQSASSCHASPTEHGEKVDSKEFVQKLRLSLERLHASWKNDMDKLLDEALTSVHLTSAPVELPPVPAPEGAAPNLHLLIKDWATERTVGSEGNSKHSEHSSAKLSGGRKRNLNLVGAGFQQNMQWAAINPIMEMPDDVRSVVPSEAGEQREFVLPTSVAGAWRRQACILAKHFREEMADEVAMAKSSMSFQGGLWWLRHVVGLRSLAAPGKAAAISACNSLLIAVLLSLTILSHLLSHGTVVDLINDIIVVLFGIIGLLVHHFYYRFSDSTPPTGEQDSMLQAHSVAFGYTRPWLIQSRQHGKQLFSLWLISISACVVSNYSHFNILPERVLASVVTFALSSGIVCAQCMRVAHICSAMKVSIISLMQSFAEEDKNFDEIVHMLNAIQIFIRTLSDGCTPSLVSQVALVPVILGGILLQITLIDKPLVEHGVASAPYMCLVLMPYYALACAADASFQCEQAPQVANSMLVGKFQDSMAQDVLTFMSRCNMGFYVNDVRLSPGSVLKSAYILAAVFITAVSYKLRSL
eukprot:TRINITY_DN13860_c0_g1_i5.p1 TRINITY_DN13860_c0_g1~~TRINITY_DN13860_c0_g1_i5.p1  ORF type:complete len:539 (-),score=72.10 TRINITY_DN13860_c0_g1_i5:89-1705(-)